MKARIYHNPNCSTSRKVLDAIRAAGEEPQIVEYLKTPPSRAELAELLKKMKKRPREILRKRGTPYEEMSLDDPKWTDDQLIDKMIEHPILIERPIVATSRGVRLCRPAETVNAIL